MKGAGGWLVKENFLLQAQKQLGVEARAAL